MVEIARGQVFEVERATITRNRIVTIFCNNVVNGEKNIFILMICEQPLNLISLTCP